MFARLFFLFRDNPVSFKKILYLSFLQILLLLIFIPGLYFIIFLLLLFGINILFYFLEKNFAHKNLIRFLSLLIIIVITGFFTSGCISINFNQNLLGFINNLSRYFFPLKYIENLNWLTVSVLTAGFLFLLNEVNFIIRYLFEAFSLIPQVNDEGGRGLDEKEYNAGRVIGMLERILILFFVVVNQFAAIGFIIAAKGFTRFKELDKREFAEYVLIGTLLSSLFAIGVALLIKQVIKY
jgi:hypothetical protein